MNWHLSLGIAADKYRFHDHVKLAHYADAALDIEYEFPFGFKEVEGIHSRTDYDLTRHQEFSKKKLQYFDTEINQHYVPYVIETSIGLDRMFLLILSNSYEEEQIQKEDGTTDSRVVLHLPAKLAPIKLAVLPLTKKDGLPELAKALANSGNPSFFVNGNTANLIGANFAGKCKTTLESVVPSSF
jgi:glycyl-tRNA synthetase